MVFLVLFLLQVPNITKGQTALYDEHKAYGCPEKDASFSYDRQRYANARTDSQRLRNELSSSLIDADHKWDQFKDYGNNAAD